MEAKLSVNRQNTISKIDKRLYGSFIEHGSAKNSMETAMNNEVMCKT